MLTNARGKLQMLIYCQNRALSLPKVNFLGFHFPKLNTEVTRIRSRAFRCPSETNFGTDLISKGNKRTTSLKEPKLFAPSSGGVVVYPWHLCIFRQWAWRYRRAPHKGLEISGRYSSRCVPSTWNFSLFLKSQYTSKRGDGEMKPLMIDAKKFH